MLVTRPASVLLLGVMLLCVSCAEDRQQTPEPTVGAESSSSSGTSSSSSASGTDESSSTAAACVPGTEVCNGIDDDCDGDVDEPEDTEQVGTACFVVGMLGECARGAFVCASATHQLVCESANTATAELCDGLDNDCDGFVDDAPTDETLGLDCETELPGQCTLGRIQCSAGALQCLNINPITPERCDGRDNDCDGEIDEGNPEGGAACNTGLPGVCREGTRGCVDAEVTCVQAVFPSEDSCGDHLDNDCDGTIDELASAPECAHTPCVTGGVLVAACHPCVAQICAVDSFCCNVSWDGICVSEVQSVCQCTCVL